MSEADDQNSQQQAQDKLGSRLDSNIEVDMTGEDDNAAVTEPNPPPPAPAPSSTPTPLRQIALKRASDTFDDELARLVAKRKRETAIYDEFEKMHGRRPSFNEVRDEEVRRGVPFEDRIVTTTQKRTPLNVAERLRSAAKFLGPAPDVKVLQEWEEFWKVFG